MPIAPRNAASQADLGPAAPRRRGQRTVTWAPDPAMPRRTIRRAVTAWSVGALYAEGQLPLVALQAAERYRDGHALARHGQPAMAAYLRETGGGAWDKHPAERIIRAAGDLRRVRVGLPPVLLGVLHLAAVEEMPLAQLAAKLRIPEDRAAEAVSVATLRAAAIWGMIAVEREPTRR